MQVHRLKTVQPFFTDIDREDKTFEVRVDDRGFKVDDVLALVPWDPIGQRERGGPVFRRVTYIMRADDMPLGCESLLPSDVVCMGLEPTPPCDGCDGYGEVENNQGERVTCSKCEGVGGPMSESVGRLAVKQPCSLGIDGCEVTLLPCKGCNGDGFRWVVTETPVDLSAKCAQGQHRIFDTWAGLYRCRDCEAMFTIAPPEPMEGPEDV